MGIAKVKIGHNGALWIYFQGRIQCFKCGWWSDAENIDEAVDLYWQHICKVELEEV